MLENVTSHVEKMLPNYVNPNAITWIGNIALYIASGLCMAYGGLKYHDTEPLPSWVLFVSAFCVQWFSVFDMMDGQRARRFKCGTPIGRLIDEAGDTMQYMMFAVIMGYVVKVPPGWLSLGYCMVNMAQYAMEMNFVINKNFKNCDEYLGPCEIEVMIAFIFVMAGIFGSEGLNSSISSSLFAGSVARTLGLGMIPEYIIWNHLLLGFFIALQMNFIIEAVVSCMRTDLMETIKLALIPFIVLGIAIFHASFDTFLYRE
jgi:phosphatidylglycerophosphate synthase